MNLFNLEKTQKNKNKNKIKAKWRKINIIKTDQPNLKKKKKKMD